MKNLNAIIYILNVLKARRLPGFLFLKKQVNCILKNYFRGALKKDIAIMPHIPARAIKINTPQ